MLPERRSVNAEDSASWRDDGASGYSRYSAGRLTDAQCDELFNCAPNAIICVDRDYNFIFANQPAMHLCGTTMLVGKNMWTLFPGNLEEPFHSNYRSTMVERVEREFEAYYGEPLNLWFKVMVRPIEVGIAIFFSEINERKRAEAQQQRDGRRLQQVFDVTADAILSLDRDWRITFVNRRAKELLAVKGNLIGKMLWEEFPATADPEGPYLKPYRRTMDERVATELEAYYPAPLDRYFTIEAQPSEDGIVLFFHDVTERRRSEESIRAQQEMLRAVQQGGLVATWTLETATGRMQYGVGSYPVFGHAFEAVSKLEDLLEIVCPADRGRVLATTREAVKDRKMFTVDFEVTAADGTSACVEARGQVLEGGDGGMRIGGIAIDISARKNSEGALAASEARYRVLTEENPQAIWMASAEGEMTYANRTFLDYLGFSAETFRATGWLDGIDERDRGRIKEVWRRCIQSGNEFRCETRMLRGADGDSRWWSMHGLAVSDDAGRVLNWLGVAIDIDDRKTAADALLAKQQETERQRSELETIYRTADIGLALFAAGDFRCLRINDYEAEILGLPQEEIIGRTLMELAPDVPGLEHIFRGVEAGTPVRDMIVEGELPSRPGEPRVWSVSYAPVYGDDGAVVSITAASLEITQQRRAQAALMHSEKLAAVGRLASSISHEINNPLEAVTNLLYIIGSDEMLPAELKGYVETAQAELSRVSQIATQTLRFHRHATNPTRVTAAELVDAVLKLYQGRLFNSGIQVETAYRTERPMLCFENDIRQVLNNLIANAIDAMANGGRLVARAHETEDAAGRKWVRITVADTGHGMTKATASRIFDPFFTTKDLNGTGLGLWISAEIVQRHHGKLRVRSAKGPRWRGAVFTLVLPCDQTPDEAPNPSAYATFAG